MWRRAPERFVTEHFALEPLGPRHNDADYAAWSTSIEHIRNTPGFRAELWGGDDWPYPMSLEQNHADLQQHADEFARGEAFAYTVLDSANGEVIGCVYIDPEANANDPVDDPVEDATGDATDDVADARCRMWVRADRADLDGALEHAVRTWLKQPEWGFAAVRFPGRDRV